MRASERAYNTLRDDILEWRLSPGTVLAEVEQSERLGISRTPLREALSKLATDGLVEQQGGRGLVVTAVSIDNVTELFELRNALEQQAARLAAQRGDPSIFEKLVSEFQSAPDLLQNNNREGYYDLVGRFDTAMDVATQNPYLVGALRSLRPHLVRVRRISEDNLDRLRAAAGEHLVIAAAVASKDPELAAAATRVHLHQSLQSILATAKKSLN